jgi:hypothetical protein
MTGVPGGRANDERVKCLRIFADGNGETHMEDIDLICSQESFSRTILRCVLRITFQPRGITFAMSQRVRGKRVGTIRRSDCLCSG